MIEQLHNCPNCGAILDDTGRCNFCGSKVYDLFDIDVSSTRGIKYIRIKTDKGMIIAPIVFNTVNIEHRSNELICTSEYVTPIIPVPDITISTEFRVVGGIIYERSEEE